jgi:lysozyme family protein
MSVKDIIDGVIEREAGYVNHPSDRGGKTNWGITEATARANGYEGRMQDMPRAIAYAIYENRYVFEPGFHKVIIYSEKIAEELIDTGVNMGPQKAAMFFQRVLNVFNGRGTKFGDLTLDGKLGSISLQALNAYLNWRGPEGEAMLLYTLNAVQTVRYIEIAENNPTQEDFVYGQIRARAFNP